MIVIVMIISKFMLIILRCKVTVFMAKNHYFGAKMCYFRLILVCFPLF